MLTCFRVPVSEKTMPRQSLHNELSEFGTVLDELLDERGWNQTQLSAETDPEVSQGQLSNYRYGRRKPKPETISVIARALTARQADRDQEERQYQLIHNRLRHAAGYRSVKKTDLSADPPENYADYPPELQEALAFAGALTPAAKTLVYQLWREQARAHHDIEMIRREAERKLVERERELAQREKL